MSRKIFVLCISDSREKLQMAAMVASVAAASGDEVTVFFSMNAMLHFVKGRATEAAAEGEFGRLMAADKGLPSFKQLFAYAADLGDASCCPVRWRSTCSRRRRKTSIRCSVRRQG